MRTIGSFEAKTRLPELLRAVEAGETVIISRRGKAIAKLVPVSDRPDAAEIAAAVERIGRRRARLPRFTLAEILAARDEGRA